MSDWQDARGLLDSQHWTRENHIQRMTTQEWKQVFLSKANEHIMFQGYIRTLKAEPTSVRGVVEVFKKPLVHNPDTVPDPNEDEHRVTVAASAVLERLRDQYGHITALFDDPNIEEEIALALEDFLL